MLDFAPDLTPANRTKTVSVTQAPPVEIVQEVKVSRPTESASYLLAPKEQWGWTELRDYVIREIEKRHGPQLRDPKKEAAIFKGFLSRWPDQAVAIAQAAFGPAHDGMWRNAPISTNRFCKASDPFFAAILAERI